ncbi:MAG: hypothetical protein M3Q99_06485 [Acidobacteriota bacterium]|nr:hypothetical protein [Acidobacteriota bacterium]
MDFTLVSAIENIEVIAVNRGIRDLARLNREFGRGRWRKLKETAHVELENGRVRFAEIHWYEAHGIGRRDMKIKRYIYE